MSRMRWAWLLLALLVANGAIYWFTQLQSQRSADPLQPSPRGAELVLIDELPGEQVEAMRREQSEPLGAGWAAAELDSQMVADSTLSDSFIVADVEPALQDIVVSASRLLAQSADPGQPPPGAELDQESLLQAAEAGAEAVLVDSAPDLALLEPVVVSAEYLPLATPAVAAQCWEFGPLTEDELALFRAEYNARESLLRQRMESVVLTADYWVYLGSDSISKLQRLQLNLSAQGVDSYVISGGPLDGNLSLGLYSLRSSAETVAEPLREQGYPVEIFVRPKETEPRYWLQLADSELEIIQQQELATSAAELTDAPCAAAP